MWLVPHCLVQFLSTVSRRCPPSHHTTVNYGCPESQVSRSWNHLWSLNTNDALAALWARAFDISVCPFVSTVFLLIWFSDSLWISCRLHFFLSSHLSIECQLIIFSVSGKSENSISLLFPPVLAIRLNSHTIAQIHSCIFPIHCTFVSSVVRPALSGFWTFSLTWGWKLQMNHKGGMFACCWDQDCRSPFAWCTPQKWPSSSMNSKPQTQICQKCRGTGLCQGFESLLPADAPDVFLFSFLM